MNNPLIERIRAKPRKVDEHIEAINPLVAKAQPKASIVAKPQPRLHQLIPQPGLPDTHEPSNLEALGNVLDVPGSMVRDVMHGKNPLDQLATPTRPNNRTPEREILDRAGYTTRNKDSAGATAASIGVGLLLDPLTYTGVGAFTRGGKALSKAGLLKAHPAANRLTDATKTTARSVIDEAGDPHAAMKAYELAGGKAHQLDEPVKHVLSFAGQDLAKPLAPAIDKAADAIKATAPIRALRSMFDPKVMNTTSESAQQVATHRKEALDDALVDVGAKFANHVRNNDLAGARATLSDIAKEAEQSGLELSKYKHWTEANDVSSALANAEQLTKASALSHAASELLGLSAHTSAGERSMSMGEAIKKLGIDTPQARKAIEDWSGQSFDSLHISKNMVDDAERMTKPIVDPQSASGVRRAIEGFTRLFRASVSLPFPGFHARNLSGGVLNNVIHGASQPHTLASDLSTAYRLRQGKTPKSLGRQIPEYKEMGLSDKEASEMLRDELFSHNISGDWQPGVVDVMKKKPDAASRMPGANPLLEKARPTIAESLNPLDVDNFIATRLGGSVAGFVEDMNRISGYVGLRKQGYSPSEAAKRIKAIQADYSDATQFENKIARNVMPFYLFSKKMLALTADELAHHPGGRLATTIKVTSKSDKDTPHHMRNEASVKIGEHHYSGFGEMHKDAVDAIGAFAKGDVRSLARQAGDKLSPLLKFPLEQATQHDIHLGTPLDKMPRSVEQLTGVPIGSLGEHAVRSSPIARYLTEANSMQKRRDGKTALLRAAGIKTSQ